MTAGDRVSQEVKVLVANAAEDYVGLWQLVKRAFRVLGSADEAEIMVTSMAITRDLLSHGLVVGELTESGGFSAWKDQAPDAVVRRIEAEWKTLGRPPNIGDVCWFHRHTGHVK